MAQNMKEISKIKKNMDKEKFDFKMGLFLKVIL